MRRLVNGAPGRAQVSEMVSNGVFRALGRGAAWLSMAVWLAACAGDNLTNTMAPKSDLGHWIDRLYWEVITWDILILVLVCGLVFLAVFAFSVRDPNLPPRPSNENMLLEVAWTAGPALILLIIAIPTVRLVFRSQPAKPPEGALIVNIVGHQWWWEAQYPQYHFVTAGEIHLPLGRPVWFNLNSADVIHSFWLPQLAGKRDVVPGHPNRILLTPEETGRFEGECTEFCGTSHANMKFMYFIDTPQDFEKWTANQASGPATKNGPVPASAGDSPEERAKIGAELFATSTCTACHSVTGISKVTFGPNLTHFGSRTTFAGATMKNTPANVKAWIRNPQSIKPGAQMPVLGVRGEELDDLAAYLESLK